MRDRAKSNRKFETIHYSSSETEMNFILNVVCIYPSFDFIPDGPFIHLWILFPTDHGEETVLAMLVIYFDDICKNIQLKTFMLFHHALSLQYSHYVVI